METAWVDDAAKFTPNLVVLPVYAGPKREKMAQFEADVLVFNTDAVKWLALQKPKFFERFDCLIIDEISAFKHHTSQRSKALRRIVKHFDYRHGMTGTPNSNRITDIWHQVTCIDDGASFGNSFFRFRSQTSVPKQVGPMPQHVQWVDKEEIEPVIGAMISDFTTRHFFDDCIDIPKNVVRKLFIDLKPKHRKFYDKFEKEALLELEEADVVGINAAVVATKLLQISSGAVYGSGTGDDKPTAVFDTTRYDLVADLVAQRDHSIVFFLWKHQRDELIRALERVGIDEYAILDGSVKQKDRVQIIRDYQAGAYKTLLLHPKTAAHGITLTRARTTIWPSPTHDAEWFKQAIHRMLRAGQDKKTETILISARGTRDERVYDRMFEKGKRMATLLEVLTDE
jgi:SNF2 family DNA or RNA helicase